MTAERRMARVLAEKWADDRAHRIASMAAEELVRSEGVPAAGPDEFAIPADQIDEQMSDCIAHLVWHGLAASEETVDGYVMVQLGGQDE